MVDVIGRLQKGSGQDIRKRFVHGKLGPKRAP